MASNVYAFPAMTSWLIRARSEPMFELVQAWKVGEPFTFTLPPGDYYIGDVCYVLSGPTYDAVGELIWDTADETGRNLLLRHLASGGLLVSWSTIVGDGVFALAADPTILDGHKDASLCVDTGLLAFIDLRIADRYT